MSGRSIAQLVRTADDITIDEIRGKKVTLKIRWYDIKGTRKSEKFSLTEKDRIEF
ncbi:MAG: hypothetical protein KGI27_11010 [Thaumarchaeota archaeon]|nr:hypothetical protein [Nitrososphaerota archaeon]